MKIYSGINGVPVPEPDYKNYDFDREEAREEEYIKGIKARCIARNGSKSPYVGKEVGFPCADGYARYVVLSSKELVHLAVGDAWDYPYAHRLTFKDIKEKIDRGESIRKLFGGS